MVVLGVWSGIGGIIQEWLLIAQLKFSQRIARAKRNLSKAKASADEVTIELSTDRR